MMFEKLRDGLLSNIADLEAEKAGKKELKKTRLLRPLTREEIREIRKSTGMSQREFCETFFFSHGTYKNWEYGHREPDASSIVMLWLIKEDSASLVRILSAIRNNRVAIH